MLNVRTAVTKAVAFITPFFDMVVGDSRVEQYLMDATYKTNQLGYDLYGVLANVRGTGFPISVHVGQERSRRQGRPIRDCQEVFARIERARFAAEIFLYGQGLVAN